MGLHWGFSEMVRLHVEHHHERSGAEWWSTPIEQREQVIDEDMDKIAKQIVDRFYEARDEKKRRARES